MPHKIGGEDEISTAVLRRGRVLAWPSLSSKDVHVLQIHDNAVQKADVVF